MLIRPFLPSDLDSALALNNACVPDVNALDVDAAAALLTLTDVALTAEVDGAFAGFCWCLAPGQPYASENYRWFASRYDDFEYLDRIAVAAEFRRFGVGRAFYAALQEQLLGVRPVLLCEVNVKPRNETSLRFHAQVGFREVGQQDTDGGAKTVSLLALQLRARQAG